ncbi:MAG: restriction endonuclease subunit S [Pseudomonadaceae bacterium]|nr:restriction endonuclease subunit S [Pseudomonadaceae bacterium]
MIVEKNVPEIRFKGFSGEWGETELANAASNFRSGKFIKAEDIKKEGAYPVYGGNGLRGFTSEYNHEGAYALIGRQGALCGNMNFSYGKAFFTEHAIAVQGNANNDTLFLYYKLGLMNLGQYSGQSAQPGLSVNKITELETFLPGHKEQTAIGNTFQKLDSLINQHQQKHNKLSKIKKAMLEKMFPKQGETMPEIRFKGFSGEWEEVRFGDVVTCFSGGTPLVGVEEYYKGNIPFIRSAEINKASTELTISESGLKNSSAKMIEVGTVLYALYGATSGEVGRAKLCGAINQAILAIIPIARMCPEFLSQWLRKSKSSIVSTYLQGGQGNLSGDIVKNLVLMSPTFEEQTAIGNYFQKLDALINQHQQQINKLNNIKQACLSKMFV